MTQPATDTNGGLLVVDKVARPGLSPTTLSLDCGWDGGDCNDKNKILWKIYPDCKGGVHPNRVGDGKCDGEPYNTAECGWDGGDCVEFNEQYPGCHVICEMLRVVPPV